MRFIADLHIHSRFSRATAKGLTLPALDFWAQKKGLAVVGTGDATHPEWLGEIEDQLVPAEEGLFRLKPVDGGEPGATRFLISSEISSIYKQGDKVRKVHSLILLPDLESAQKLSTRLARIGNIASDGRPILGLSAKDLLAITLDISPEAFFIPAHIWTPWFSVLGSKSGFDSIEECFEDLSPMIHALETGLSSDPPMNWRLSCLDRFVLVSNSDAHSPEKLGREANLFDTDLSYPALIQGLKGQGGFEGTIEFFPEEGKYHLDGHRKCGQRLDPEETRSLGGLCPVCGRPVTVGVMNRVLELADRPQGEKPPKAAGFHSLIPLAEVLGELMGVGSKSKRVVEQYERLLLELGPELHILKEAPLSDLTQAGGKLLATAVERMRSGQVRAEAGYDGEFGRIGLFKPGEKEVLGGQTRLFASGTKTKRKKACLPEAPSLPEPAPAAPPKANGPLLASDDPLVDGLNPEQHLAVTAGPGPLVVIAGPGTGKTLVLTRRAAWLIREGLARPDQILGLTFTRQAAGEMAGRLAGLLPFRLDGANNASILTFHALGLKILSEQTKEPITILSEEERLVLAKETVQGRPWTASEFIRRISLAKQDLLGPEDQEDPEFAQAFHEYETGLNQKKALDFDDLVAQPVKLLISDPDLAKRLQERFAHILIDEYQDLNQAQYRLARLLAPAPDANLMVIGDPDQAIYGFRGANPVFFNWFSLDYPQARSVRLLRNYRSTETILKASGQVINNNPMPGRPALTSGLKGPPRIVTAGLASPKAEAEYILIQIEKLLGGTSHFALDSGRSGEGRTGNSELGFSDVAILFRLHALADPMAEALTRAGLPFQRSGEEPLRETDELNFSADKINLLSMHAAKGLEFELVFILGLEKKILPFHPPQKAPADLEEERRLFYVALTRARKHLFLTHAKSRILYGKKLASGPSIFLSEIRENLKKADQLPKKVLRPKDTQMNLF